ncbi:MAG TPA: ISAs1 family transposase [Segetibacter sp.]
MTGLIRFFEAMEDPRVERTKHHKIIDIIIITIAAVICGCEDWNEIELFGKFKKEWLSTFLELPNGIPSHDTFNRFFAALNPEALQQCFLNWIQEVARITEGRIISIDGKRLCGSGVEGKKAIVHMVSAWCNANNMVLGQVKTDDKSNEITAIPELLNLLDIKGCTVTIDAMGCQTEIAAKIIEKEADYLLAVKGNQGHLFDDIKEAFEHTASGQQPTATTLEVDHGRIEKRTCHVIDDVDWICNNKEWKGLKRLIKITAERTDKSSGEQSQECRYYISSSALKVNELLSATRQHWGIENKLHWMLDVNFGEDASQKRAGNAAQNFSVITRIALNLLQNEKSKKLSIKKKRLAAGWEHSYLEKLLFG